MDATLYKSQQVEHVRGRLTFNAWLEIRSRREKSHQLHVHVRRNRRRFLPLPLLLCQPGRNSKGENLSLALARKRTRSRYQRGNLLLQRIRSKRSPHQIGRTDNIGCTGCSKSSHLLGQTCELLIRSVSGSRSQGCQKKGFKNRVPTCPCPLVFLAGVAQTLGVSPTK